MAKRVVISLSTSFQWMCTKLKCWRVLAYCRSSSTIAIILQILQNQWRITQLRIKLICSQSRRSWFHGLLVLFNVININSENKSDQTMSSDDMIISACYTCRKPRPPALTTITLRWSLLTIIKWNYIVHVNNIIINTYESYVVCFWAHLQSSLHYLLTEATSRPPVSQSVSQPQRQWSRKKVFRLRRSSSIHEFYVWRWIVCGALWSFRNCVSRGCFITATTAD